MSVAKMGDWLSVADTETEPEQIPDFAEEAAQLPKGPDCSLQKTGHTAAWAGHAGHP